MHMQTRVSSGSGFLKYDQYGSAWLLLMDRGWWQVGLSAPITASCPKPQILHQSSPHTPINPTPAPALSTFPLLFIRPCFFTLSTPVDLIMEMSIHAGPLKSRLVGIGALFLSHGYSTGEARGRICTWFGGVGVSAGGGQKGSHETRTGLEKLSIIRFFFETRKTPMRHGTWTSPNYSFI